MLSNCKAYTQSIVWVALCALFCVIWFIQFQELCLKKYFFL
jgi:hypothetical protein